MCEAWSGSDPGGSSGEGPGEFRSPSAVGLLGDRLWVTDPALSRVTLFEEGQLAETFRPQAVMDAGWGEVPIYPAGVLSDGTVYGQPRVPVGGRAGTSPDSVPLVRMTPTGDVLGVLAWVERERTLLDLQGVAGPGVGIVTRHPFPLTDLHGFSPDGRVWLRGMDRLEPEPVDWWVVDPEEGIAARLSSPVDFDGVLVRGSDLWGVRTGELDVERVVQLRVRRPD